MATINLLIVLVPIICVPAPAVAAGRLLTAPRPHTWSDNARAARAFLLVDVGYCAVPEQGSIASRDGGAFNRLDTALEL
ncbi:hypothetical protein DW352_05680 [Pseudolabrys taiwanensis]|uniref:Uncharacterized protein n=1 Tax=Pseudolabrys taiwanensis TaxID=331696 RepID=A0A345ZT03_9HYPH|nr:hypothetical protein DW352_05680 [Pseudolabrys taiwanensis]